MDKNKDKYTGYKTTSHFYNNTYVPITVAYIDDLEINYYFNEEYKCYSIGYFTPNYSDKMELIGLYLSKGFKTVNNNVLERVTGKCTTTLDIDTYENKYMLTVISDCIRRKSVNPKK